MTAAGINSFALKDFAMSEAKPTARSAPADPSVAERMSLADVVIMTASSYIRFAYCHLCLLIQINRVKRGTAVTRIVANIRGSFHRWTASLRN